MAAGAKGSLRGATGARIERSVAAAIGGTPSALEAVRCSLATIVRELGCSRGVVWSVDARDRRRRDPVAEVEYEPGEEDCRLVALTLPVGGSDAGVLEILAPGGRSDDDLRALLAPTLVQLGQCVDRMVAATRGVRTDVAANRSRPEWRSAELETSATQLEWPATHQRASTDHLTGLLSHGAFQERLTSEYERSRAEGSSLSLAVFDIDDFRRINAACGHGGGDVVLREVARRLDEAMGQRGVLGRVGGEEFAWLTKDDPAEAWRSVEAARRAVGLRPVIEMAVSVSAGFADASRAHDAEELYRFASGALYWAKLQGRDTAFQYSPEVVEALSPAEWADRLQRSQALQSIRVLARAVDAKDPSTAQHSERVADLASALATAVGWGTLHAARLHEAGLVHDVGKIAIPDVILFKPSALSEDEMERLRGHALIGAQIVDGVLASDQVSWILGHHERWDGGGYPNGLAAEGIPEGARLIALADAWDVMTSNRPYKRALTRREAMQEVQDRVGSHFWPDAVDALGRIVAAGALPADVHLGVESSRRPSEPDVHE